MGTGCCGKTTIFKQLRNIYGNPLTRAERRIYVQYIHEQCITQMRHSVDCLQDIFEDSSSWHSKNLKQYCTIDDPANYEFPHLTDKGMEAADFIAALHHTKYRLTENVVEALKILREEPAMKKMNEFRNITGIEDSTLYFWDKLDAIKQNDYVPDEMDCLLAYMRNTG